MKSKSVKIIQPAGIGDILYCQKIARRLCWNYGRVYWPLAPQLSYIPQYINYPDNLYFCEPPLEMECDVLDLQSAFKHRDANGGGIMQAKYAMAGVDGADWQDSVDLKYKDEECIDLIIALGVSPNERYALVCHTYGTPPQTFRAEFEPQTALRIVEIVPVKKYTPFDWGLLIANATEIYFVDTCFTYLAELLSLQAKKLCLYPRSQHHDKITTKGLWKKPWQYMEEK